MEVWKDIESHKSLYEVSSFGNISSLNYNKTKKRKNRPVQIHTNEYSLIRLSKKGITTNHFVHRLVAQAFIPNPENKPQVNHKNGIRNDNRLDNLEWVTAKENTSHGMKRGTIGPLGELHQNSKVTEKEVLEIRSKYIYGEYGYMRLGKEYGVSHSTIKDIVLNRRWTHI